MKLVITADWHLGISKVQDEDILRGCKEIGDRGEGEQLIILGDMFDKPKPSPELNQFFGECLAATEHDVISIISGNHDVTAVMNNVRHYDSSFIKEDVKAYTDIMLISEGNVEYIYAPFVKNVADFGSCLHDKIEGINKNFKKRSKRILITHLDIPGAKFGSEREVSMDDVGSLPVVKEIDYIISGHIHKHQSGVYGKIPYVYPGSLGRITHSEERESKGFIIFDTDELSFEFVKRKTALKWFTVNIDFKGKFPSFVQKGDIARINIKAPGKYRGQIDRAKIYKKALEKYKQVSVNIEYAKRVSKEARQVARGLSFAEYENAWINENAKGNKETVRKKIKSILKNIPDDQVVNKKYKGLYIKSIEGENYQALKKICKKFNKNDCIGILGEVNGESTKNNGTGKSSLVEFIKWVKYGVTRFSKNSSVITDGEEKAYGKIVYGSTKNDEIVLERTITEKKSNCFVFVNGEIVAKGREVIEWVDGNFGGNLKIYENLISIRKNENSLIGKKPTARLLALQEPLPLEKYTKYALNIVKKERADTIKLVNAAEGVIDEFSELEDQQESINNSEEELRECRGDLKKLEVDLNKNKVEQKKLNKQKDSLFKRMNLVESIENLKSIIQNEETSLKDYGKTVDLDPIEKKGKDLKKLLEKKNVEAINISKKIGEYDSDIKAINENLELLKVGICDACGSTVTDEHVKKEKGKKISKRSEINIDLSEKKKEADLLRKEILKLETEVEECRSEYRNTKNDNDEIQELTIEIRKNKKELKKKEDDLKKLPALQKGKTTSIENLEKFINKFVKDEDKLNLEIEDYKDSIVEFEKEIEQFNSDWARYQKAKVELKKREKESTILNICYDAFSPKGIPYFILIKIIDEINAEIPGVINDFGFWNCSDVFFEMIDEAVIIRSTINNKPEREYAGLSAGEKGITNFVGVEAYKRVLQNLVEINDSLVEIDEALDELDFANFQGALKYYRKKKIQAFCITHREGIKDQFTKVVVIKSDGNYAEVI
jgi:DNA repair exonuclease SbcCD nuclease subunit/DNA repair exonuclease SbcCD ATPase subunit